MPLSEKNIKLIRKVVANSGAIIKDKLIPSEQIPIRNAFAHIWKEIKKEFGKSYNECDDSDIPRMLQLINKTIIVALDEYEKNKNQ